MSMTADRRDAFLNRVSPTPLGVVGTLDRDHCSDAHDLLGRGRLMLSVVARTFVQLASTRSPTLSGAE
jgi:hypothetical protein